MKLSARNVFRGTVVSVNKAQVAATVKVDVGGGNVVTSTILAESVDDLGISEGDTVSVVIKSSDIMIAK